MVRTRTLRDQISRQLHMRFSAQSHWAYHVGALLFFALLTAVTARLAVPLPFTPVPITLQVWAVLLSGLVLGSRGGAWSQIAYLGALAAGLPISTTGLGGPGVFLGPTGGYLLAFPAGAFVAGVLVERFTASSSAHARPGLWSLGLHILAGLAGVVTIYAGGVAWLTVLLGDVRTAVLQGALPFLAADLVKSILAAVAAGGGRLFFRPPRR